MRVIILLMALLVTSGVVAMTRNYTIVSETLLPDVNEILCVHYTDSNGNDEVVIVKMSQLDAMDDAKLARTVLKSVWRVESLRGGRRHSIKNDPTLKKKPGQRTVTTTN